MTLSEAAKALPPRPVISRSIEKNLTSAIEVRGDTVEATVNLSKEDPAKPEGAARSLLERHGLNPDQFVVTGFRSSEWSMPNGELGTSTRFTFARSGSPAATGSALPDLDDLHATIKRDRRKAPVWTVAQDSQTVAVVLADFQTGKTGARGGTEELLRRSEASLARFERYVKKIKPAEILVLDAGDPVEGFENAGPQERTNDLQLTEQIRVWRRIFWSWIDAAARLAPSVKVAAVPSNHGRVRRGKAEMGTPNDDYGIEVLTQVSDMAGVYPEKYEHVKFFAPSYYEESVAIETVGGKVVGLVHGHQAKQAARMPVWLAGQAAGRSPVGSADIVFAGHYHALQVGTWGDHRYFFIAPTSDAGSDWFRNLSGMESAPGVLAMTIDGEGWRDLAVL
jgi:hypothetical protein